MMADHYSQTLASHAKTALADQLNLAPVDALVTVDATGIVVRLKPYQAQVLANVLRRYNEHDC